MIRHAIKQAERSTFYRARIGAVLVNSGRVISKGRNRIRYYHESEHIDHKHISSLHAEVDAIIKAPHHSLKGAVLYVARIKKNGDLALAKPCKFCAELIKQVGIKRVVYTGEIHE